MRFRRRNQAREEELAAFANGSLATEGRAALEERISASPELADRLAEQERALGLRPRVLTIARTHIPIRHGGPSAPSGGA